MGIVFDPSRFGEVLGEFALGHCADLALAVEYDGARTARPLVERQDVLFHKA